MYGEMECDATSLFKMVDGRVDYAVHMQDVSGYRISALTLEGVCETASHGFTYISDLRMYQVYLAAACS